MKKDVKKRQCTHHDQHVYTRLHIQRTVNDISLYYFYQKLNLDFYLHIVLKKSKDMTNIYVIFSFIFQVAISWHMLYCKCVRKCNYLISSKIFLWTFPCKGLIFIIQRAFWIYVFILLCLSKVDNIDCSK